MSGFEDHTRENVLVIREIKYDILEVNHGSQGFNTIVHSFDRDNYGVRSRATSLGSQEICDIEQEVFYVPISREKFKFNLPKQDLPFFFGLNDRSRLERYGFMADPVIERSFKPNHGHPVDMEMVELSLYADVTAVDPRAMDAVSAYIRTTPDLRNQRDVAQLRLTECEKERREFKIHAEDLQSELDETLKDLSSVKCEMEKLMSSWLVRSAVGLYELWLRMAESIKPRSREITVTDTNNKLSRYKVVIMDENGAYVFNKHLSATSEAEARELGTAEYGKDFYSVTATWVGGDK